MNYERADSLSIKGSEGAANVPRFDEFRVALLMRLVTHLVIILFVNGQGKE